jgi:hypothetical protein
MLKNEAIWFRDTFRKYSDADVFPMLNIGSHTEEFRTKEQPWVDKYIFAPPRNRGQKIVHTDIRNAPGVDLVGDLTDPAFLQTLASMRFKSVFCSNLLEHVVNRSEIGSCCVSALSPGGFLFVSCPHTFPYHPDPIDTMFRPTGAELAACFAGTELVTEARVRCGNLTTYLLGRALGSPSAIAKMLFARKKQTVKQTSDGMSARQWLPWLVKPFYQTCIVLRKTT